MFNVTKLDEFGNPTNVPYFSIGWPAGGVKWDYISSMSKKNAYKYYVMITNSVDFPDWRYYFPLYPNSSNKDRNVGYEYQDIRFFKGSSGISLFSSEIVQDTYEEAEKMRDDMQGWVRSVIGRYVSDAGEAQVIVYPKTVEGENGKIETVYRYTIGFLVSGVIETWVYTLEPENNDSYFYSKFFLVKYKCDSDKGKLIRNNDSKIVIKTFDRRELDDTFTKDDLENRIGMLEYKLNWDLTKATAEKLKEMGYEYEWLRGKADGQNYKDEEDRLVGLDSEGIRGNGFNSEQLQKIKEYYGNNPADNPQVESNNERQKWAIKQGCSYYLSIHNNAYSAIPGEYSKGNYFMVIYPPEVEYEKVEFSKERSFSQVFPVIDKDWIDSGGPIYVRVKLNANSIYQSVIADRFDAGGIVLLYSISVDGKDIYDNKFKRVNRNDNGSAADNYLDMKLYDKIVFQLDSADIGNIKKYISKNKVKINFKFRALHQGKDTKTLHRQFMIL